MTPVEESSDREANMVLARRAAAAVIEVIRSAVHADGCAISDRELLRRFAAEGDQAAFAALVRRHGPMVLGVCRRALPTLQDAEDACQATFLILAQKAGGICWQSSVANWLFSTARKVARNARVAARRRARREARAAVPEAVQPIDQMSARELLAALDEELERLPPRYREPLVLCYLEGLSREEAAGRLGVPPATVKTRLERGRRRLGDALTRRGCALGAGLLALAATSSAGASGPRLVESVLAACAGPSPAAAALAKGVAVNGLLNKSMLLVLALAGAVALGAGLWLASPRGGARPPEQGAPKAALPPKEKAPRPDPAGAAERQTVSGRVLGPDGKPVPRAAIYLFGWKKGNKPAPAQRVATTDADGRFTCDAGRASAGLRHVTFVATARGAALDWAPLDESRRELTLRLATEVPIRGRLLDLEGRPVAGAVVKVRTIGTYAGGNLQPAFNAMRLNPEWLSFEKQIDPPAPAFTPAMKTDAGGRFELAGVGKDRIAVLRFEAAGIEHARVYVVTRPDFDPKAVLPGAREQARRGFVPGLRHAVYGPNFTHSAKPSHPLSGRVTDARTGKPIPNVTVVGAAGPVYADGEPYWGNALETRTDGDGRFRLSGLPKAARRFLHLQPGDNPYLDRVVEVKDVEALKPVSVDIKLEGGVMIEGRITDKVTGKPVKGQAHYLPLTGNTELNKLADARLYKGGLFSARPTGTWESTDDDGRFKLRVPRGPGLVLVRADTYRDPAARYTAIRMAEGDRKFLQKRDPQARSTLMTRGAKTRDRRSDDEAFSTHSLTWPLRWENGYAIINPGAKDATVKLTIRLDPGRAVSGRVVGPDGKPAAGVQAVGVQATNEHKPTTFRGSTFTAYALSPDRPREMVFVHPQKKLVGTLTVRAGDKPPVVKLRPWAVLAGRVLNPDGSAAANARVTFQLIDGITDELVRQRLYQNSKRVQTDKDGRFRLEGMIPGAEVELFANAPGVRYGSGSRPVVPKAGETVDVGDIKLPSPRE
jgi:RNA polymerase sigma factor (sigma-70 family)